MRSSGEILRSLEQFGIRLGLEIAGLLDKIGRPHEGLPAKSSSPGPTRISATLVAAIAAGRVGLYTSPTSRRSRRIRVDWARIWPDRPRGTSPKRVLAAAARQDAAAHLLRGPSSRLSSEFRRAGVDLAVSKSA
ncbi:MAG: hypothetical protein R2862_08560 [Thermoanaerobaculia bacterium]